MNGSNSVFSQKRRKSQTYKYLDLCNVESFAKEDRFGMHVTIWNLDGSLYDFNVFPLGDISAVGTENDFSQFAQGVDDGLIVGIAVFGDLGVSVVPDRKWELVYSAIEYLGGITSGTSQIRNVLEKEAYAFITLTGDTQSTKEQRVERLTSQTFTQTSKQKYVHQENQLEFRSRSLVKGKDDSKEQNKVDFAVLSTDVSQPIITVRDDVSSWNPGDEIIVTSTDYDWKQVQQFRLLECSPQECDNNQVKLDDDFLYSHFGEITYGVDERAEVALLTRNILIEGELQAECYDNGNADEALLCSRFNRDTYGGHIKFLRGFTSVHVEGVELFHMGQQLILGSYPLHFHMCDDVDGAWVRYNSIHHTNNRCVTIHGTDGCEVTGNVCFDHPGHGFFLEDSAEQRNILDGNIGVGTRFGTQLLSDFDEDWCDQEIKIACGCPGTFWITHPNNIIRNNVAAGSEKNGFHITYATSPLTLSKARQEIRGLVYANQARWSKIAQFENNVAHSNGGRGIYFDGRISTGEIDNRLGLFVPENGFISFNSYDPRDPPEKGAPRTTSYLSRLNLYRNKKQNIWARGGNIVIENSSFADSPVNIAMLRSFRDTTQEVKHSVIIGESDNLGLPFEYTYGKHPNKPKHTFNRSLATTNPFRPLVGMKFFTGPAIITDSIFDKFNHLIWDPTWENLYGVKAFRPASAMGFKSNFPYPSLPHSGPRQVRFGFCDKIDGISVFAGDTSLPFYENPRDGDRQATLRDIDGSITGLADVQLVRNTPFFMDSECYYDEIYQMSVCPHWYSKTIFNGKDGVLTGAKSKDFPMYMVRDDVTDYPFSLKGEKALSYLTMQDKSYIAIFNGTNPSVVTLKVNNLQYERSIRLGLCFPKATTSFTITGVNPTIDKNNPAISVNSIAELEADTTGRAYFWDQPRGLFFVNFVGRESIKIAFEECPNFKCPERTIRRNDGGDTPIDCFNDAYVTGPYKVAKTTKPPVVPPVKTCVRASTDGYGAVDPAEYDITAPEFTTSCPTFNTTSDLPVSENKGCYKTTSPGYLDDTYETQILKESLTLNMCINRCYSMQYKYATVAFGDTCRCSDSFTIYGEESTSCTKACTGNADQICGGSYSYDVYTTGYVISKSLETCGTDSLGATIEGKCYIYKSDSLTYIQAERECRTLGGNLATIPNSDIQEMVEQYLNPPTVDIWFGLNDAAVESSFAWTDGSPLGSFTYFSTQTGVTSRQHFGLLLANSFYRWTKREASELHPFLCQISIPSTPLTIASCGINNAGNRLGDSDKCYAVPDTTGTYIESKYRCHRMMGVLAPMKDAATQEEIVNHLILFGGDINYWVDEAAETSNTFKEMRFTKFFSPGDMHKNKANGAVCLLDTLNADKPCATGWRKFGNHCYLYTAQSTSVYTDALAYCNGGLSSLLSIESEQENIDVVTLVKEFNPSVNPPVMLGYKYNSILGEFEWSDGSTSAYTKWINGQGVNVVADKGECAKLLTSRSEWKNKDCFSSNAHIVCKADIAT